MKFTKPTKATELARILGVAPQLLYREAREGRLPHTRIGNRVVIPAWVANALVEGRPLKQEQEKQEAA